MEQINPARLIVKGRPTAAELAALVCALESAGAEAEDPGPARPRVWQRTSWRSHVHQLHATLPPTTDPGHRHLVSHPLEES